MRLPVIVHSFVFSLAGLLIAFLPFYPALPAHTERVFQVEASSFRFDPAVLKVDPGDRVTIELTSSDVVHGLYIDGYGLQVSADPGQTNRLTFVADQIGSFRLRCSVTCGDLHPFMIGKLRVGPNLLLWRGTGMVVLISLFLATMRRHKTDLG